MVVVVVALGVRAGMAARVGARGGWDLVRERWPLEERGEDGRRAEGEAQGVGDYAGSAGGWECGVACYEVVGVHDRRGIFEDIVQTLAGEREGP